VNGKKVLTLSVFYPLSRRQFLSEATVELHLQKSIDLLQIMMKQATLTLRILGLICFI